MLFGERAALLYWEGAASLTIGGERRWCWEILFNGGTDEPRRVREQGEAQ
jgi:hypothetical protein